MSWLSRFWTPSPEARLAVENLSVDIERTRDIKKVAQDKLQVAHAQATVLNQMNIRNHYSASLTQALRSRRP